ncbi:MAG TPA: 2-amino-4-hydroxy-6-hydroxymethyldihydropteridine diphosphokinase [Clostridiales bacterium]|nr:2-amino-4-hydroxy-6-hydroxymethyldihydropteridine diphosphokinase [Clostridiales bacterium]
MESEAYIALGSNMGNRVENLQRAINAISKLDKTSVVKMSRIYETEPVGYKEQDKFLNMVIMTKTGLKPLELLDKLQGIENMLKRKRIIHWGPRTIDLDILIYDNINIGLPRLTIPHPEMLGRAFVLIPLREIAPDMEFNHIGIDYFIEKCDDKEEVRIYNNV